LLLFTRQQILLKRKFMKSHLTTSFIHSAAYAVIAATIAVSLLAAGFFAFEPRISHGQVASDTADFYIRQTITDETSFLTNPTNVTMVGDLNGVTGGTATGTTYFRVSSNNATGYYVEIDFFDNAGANAMYGDVTGSESLRDYSGDVAGQPSYNFTASTAAQFAYTVYSSTTADTAGSFLNDTADCNVSTTQTPGKCWKAPSTSGFRIVDRDSSASTGATTTIQFKVHVPSGATPIPSAETYTATATLSVFTQ